MRIPFSSLVSNVTIISIMIMRMPRNENTTVTKTRVKLSKGSLVIAVLSVVLEKDVVGGDVVGRAVIDITP